MKRLPSVESEYSALWVGIETCNLMWLESQWNRAFVRAGKRARKAGETGHQPGLERRLTSAATKGATRRRQAGERGTNPHGCNASQPGKRDCARRYAKTAGEGSSRGQCARPHGQPAGRCRKAGTGRGNQGGASWSGRGRHGGDFATASVQSESAVVRREASRRSPCPTAVSAGADRTAHILLGGARHSGGWWQHQPPFLFARETLVPTGASAASPAPRPAELLRRRGSAVPSFLQLTASHPAATRPPCSPPPFPPLPSRAAGCHRRSSRNRPPNSLGAAVRRSAPDRFPRLQDP